MEDFNTPHPDYLKGFNEGYLLQEHLPELADKLSRSLGDSERSVGFQDGRKQMLIEKQKDRRPKWLNKDRLSSLDKDVEDKEKDKGDLEKE